MSKPDLYHYELPDEESGPQARQFVLWKGKEVEITAVHGGWVYFGDYHAPKDLFKLSSNTDMGSGAGGWEITDEEKVEPLVDMARRVLGDSGLQLGNRRIDQMGNDEVLDLWRSIHDQATGTLWM